MVQKADYIIRAVLLTAKRQRDELARIREKYVDEVKI